MQNVLRTWHCRNCGRTNETEIALDGKVKCQFCASVTRIQPSRVRGLESPGQLSSSRPRTP